MQQSHRRSASGRTRHMSLRRHLAQAAVGALLAVGLVVPAGSSATAKPDPERWVKVTEKRDTDGIITTVFQRGSESMQVGSLTPVTVTGTTRTATEGELAAGSFETMSATEEEVTEELFDEIVVEPSGFACIEEIEKGSCDDIWVTDGEMLYGVQLAAGLTPAEADQVIADFAGMTPPPGDPGEQ